MNNVNTQELSRANVADGSTTKGRTAAKSSAEGGKVLPDASQAQKPQEQVLEKASAQRADKVEQAVARLNDYVQSLQRDLHFTVDEDLGRTVVSVVDRNSQEIIRQIPSENALNLARNLKGHIEAELRSGENGLGSSLGLINTRI